jgi:oligopeptide/dipeptide ABC transporter ATP-binding protein
MGMERLVKISNLKIYFPTITGLAAYFRPQRFIKAVDDISFDINRGEILALVGESGCGKTSTGLAILRLIKNIEGEIIFNGKEVLKLRKGEIRKLREEIQMVFQDPYESLNPRMSVFQLVAEPLRVHRLEVAPERIERALELANLTPPQYFVNKFPHELSGGERQRVSIAAALVLEPQFLVLDEPVSNLDVSIKAEILNLFLDLQKELGLTYLFITHDLADTFYLSDRLAVMYLGKIVEIGPKESIKENPAHPYTKALLSVIPSPSLNKKKRIILKGDVPDPIDIPSGCRFHPRCPLSRPICKEEQPELVEVNSAHLVACHFA